MIRELRKKLILKARPMPKYRFMKTRRSSRQLTVPRSPAFTKLRRWSERIAMLRARSRLSTVSDKEQ
jgi:hypothetical protein